MDNRELAVRGIGKACATPDLIVLNMNIEVCEKDYGRTMRRSSEMLDMLKSAIVSAGHDGKELKTTSFVVNTRYDHSGHKPRFSGYTCRHGLKLEFDFDMQSLGATLEAVAGCESKPNFHVRFTIKDPGAVSEQLLESAIENSRRNATVLAKAAGVALGAIRRIDYNWSELHLISSTDYQPLAPTACMDATLRTMDIEPEDIHVSDTVMVIWAIE